MKFTSTIISTADRGVGKILLGRASPSCNRIISSRYFNCSPTTIRSAPLIATNTPGKYQIQPPAPTVLLHPTTSTQRFFKTSSSNESTSSALGPRKIEHASLTDAAMTDLFRQFSESLDDNKNNNQVNKDSNEEVLTMEGIRQLLESIGERPDEETLESMFKSADLNNDGVLQLDEFLSASDYVLGGAPARIIIVVGGPGSGKGILCTRLAEECGVTHVSGGDLLRDEVKRGTKLGKQCEEIMNGGGLVSSAVMTTLIRKHMQSFPGQRILLDGFPRSVENAHDFIELMGTPEVALHLECDDTILMERIIKRGEQAKDDVNGEGARSDDNFDTALQRLRTFHKYHKPTMDWLRGQHVPIVHLDCSGTPENVWNQLLAIGRLMRPVAQINGNGGAQLEKGRENADLDGALPLPLPPSGDDRSMSIFQKLKHRLTSSDTTKDGIYQDR